MSMGYVANALPAGVQTSQKMAVCEDFTGGVCFGSDSLQNDGKIPYMYNMINDSGVLRTRDALTMLYNGKKIEGEFYGSYQKEFSGHVIIHVGKYLVAASYDEDEPTVLYDNMPLHKSLMTCFCGKLYVYCNTYVFSVDMELNFKEEMPEPLHFDFTGYSGTIAENTYNYNLLAPVVSATFNTYPPTPATVGFPNGRDTSKPFRVLYNGEPYDETKYTLVNEGQAVKFSGNDYTKIISDIKFVYYLANPSDIGFENTFDSLSVIESYGGETLSGTRVYASGNEKEPGKIYISELMNPLNFPKESCETVGGDIDNITGFIRQYGKMLVFTKNNVMRMSYSFSGGVPVYTFKEINSQIGCDMPGSIQLIDNRVVFANSTKGVFIIDSTEDFGEQNIKPISENINGRDELAFSGCAPEDKAKAVSIDYDRKYILAMSDRMYVWDYGNVPFYESGNYSKAQKRLEWYVNTGISARFLLECGGKLMCACENEGISVGVFENTGKDFGVPVHWCYQSEKLAFGYPTLLKTPEKLVLGVKNAFSGRMKISVGDENENYFNTEIYVDANDGRYNRIALTLPKKRVRKMYFRLEGDMPVQLYSVAIYYRMSKKQR